MARYKEFSLGRAVLISSAIERMTDRLSRAFTQEKAQSYGITGFVKNTSDGKVR